METNVTYPKFLAYLQELVAEESIIDEDDDYYSIKPLRINVRQGCEGELPGPSLIDLHVTAMVDLYEQQASLEGQPRSLMKSPLRTREVAAIIKKYKLRYSDTVIICNQKGLVYSSLIHCLNEDTTMQKKTMALRGLQSRKGIIYRN